MKKLEQKEQQSAPQKQKTMSFMKKLSAIHAFMLPKQTNEEHIQQQSSQLKAILKYQKNMQLNQIYTQEGAIECVHRQMQPLEMLPEHEAVQTLTKTIPIQYLNEENLQKSCQKFYTPFSTINFSNWNKIEDSKHMLKGEVKACVFPKLRSRAKAKKQSKMTSQYELKFDRWAKKKKRIQKEAFRNYQEQERAKKQKQQFGTERSDEGEEEEEEEDDQMQELMKQCGGQKPKWAMTQDEVEEQAMQDEDNLLDFASNLDFEDYLQDFEVKTMLQALKHRVKEIKKEEQGDVNPQEQEMEQVQDKVETRSQISNASNQTRQSIREMRQKMAQQQLENREDWDSSVKGDPHVEYEQRLANKIADEILKRSKTLRMVHSKKSIKALIGEEAKNFLRKGAQQHPSISVIKDHNKEHINQVSRAPNLYRNPAI